MDSWDTLLACLEGDKPVLDPWTAYLASALHSRGAFKLTRMHLPALARRVEFEDWVDAHPESVEGADALRAYDEILQGVVTDINEGAGHLTSAGKRELLLVLLERLNDRRSERRRVGYLLGRVAVAAVAVLAAAGIAAAFLAGTFGWAGAALLAIVGVGAAALTGRAAFRRAQTRWRARGGDTAVVVKEVTNWWSGRIPTGLTMRHE